MILISKMHKTTNLILDIRLVETKKSKLSILTSTRRHLHGSTHEKWRNENFQSHLLRSLIRNYNRSRSLFRGNRWINLRNHYSHVLKLRCWSYVILSIRRINSRIQSTIPRKNDGLRKHDWFLNRYVCH